MSLNSFYRYKNICWKRANSILDCIRKSITSGAREEIIPIYPALMRPQQEYCMQLWALHKNDMDVLGWVQGRTAKAIRGLEHLPCVWPRKWWSQGDSSVLWVTLLWEERLGQMVFRGALSLGDCVVIWSIYLCQNLAAKGFWMQQKLYPQKCFLISGTQRRCNGSW